MRYVVLIAVLLSLGSAPSFAQNLLEAVVAAKVATAHAPKAQAAADAVLASVAFSGVRLESALDAQPEGFQVEILKVGRTCTRSGPFTNCNGSGGSTTCTTSGPFTNCHGSGGSTTCTTSGPFTNCHGSGGTTTCTRSGPFLNCHGPNGSTTCVESGPFTHCN